jgi:hypothetical protein
MSTKNEKSKQKEIGRQRLVVSGVEAKQGVKLGITRYVLLISMTLVIAGFLVTWIVERL